MFPGLSSLPAPQSMLLVGAIRSWVPHFSASYANLDMLGRTALFLLNGKDTAMIETAQAFGVDIGGAELLVSSGLRFCYKCYT